MCHTKNAINCTTVASTNSVCYVLLPKEKTVVTEIRVDPSLLKVVCWWELPAGVEHVQDSKPPGVYSRVSGVAEWMQEQICTLSDTKPSYCGYRKLAVDNADKEDA